MAATATVPTPPAKLSPSERLVRKRAAARLRQQRCRARKRQAMLESRRQLELSQSPPQTNQDSRMTVQGANNITIATNSPRRPTPSTRDHHLRRTSNVTVTTTTSTTPFSTHGSCSTPPRYIQGRSGEGDYWSDSSSSSGPIQSVVSFGSQGSFEELQHQRSYNKNKYERIPHKPPPVVSPSAPKPPVEIVRLAEKNSAEPLVAEEEAAVAAMLSLKSGPSSSKSTSPTKKTSSPPPPPPRPVLYKRDTKYPTRSDIAPRVAKYRYGSNWEPRIGGERFDYGRPPPRPIRVVEYHPIPPPPPPMGAMYRYYPAFESRYERYSYD